MQKSTLRTLILVALFSISMGFLETAVVIYIRELYYPEGFAFPLKMMSINVAFTELLRELATLIMLITIGLLAGRTKNEKFAYFIYSFGIWDIFYYIFLKLLINWPESIMTWDILFLLPTTWVGPVIAPVLLSLVMILLALAITYLTDKMEKPGIKSFEWACLIIGSLIVIVSFTIEYTNYMLDRFSFSELLNFNGEFLEYAIQYVPHQFPWLIFIPGFVIILSGIVLFIIRNKSIFKNKISDTLK